MIQIAKIIIILVAATICSGVKNKPFSKPCLLKDHACDIKLWKSEMKRFVSGSSKLKIPSLDPLPLENIDVDVPKVTKLHFEGQLKGFNNCTLEDAVSELKRGRFKKTLQLNCKSNVVTGLYTASGNGSIIFGTNDKDQSLNADGKGKVKLENMRITFIMDYKIIKTDGNQVKFVLKEKPIAYKYKINGPVKFAVTNIYLGAQDISPLVTAFMNQNWEFIVNNDGFGEPFLYRAFNIIGQYQKLYFDNLLAKDFYSDDMEQFVLN